MKTWIAALCCLPIHVLHPQHAAGIGFADFRPINRFDIQGNVAIGHSYAGEIEAPPNGLLVQGNTGIGVLQPGCALEVAGQTWLRDTLRLPGPLLHSLQSNGSSLVWQAASPVEWRAPAGNHRIDLRPSDGELHASGYLQSGALAGTGMQQVMADAQGRLVPGGSGLLTLNAGYQWQPSATTPAMVQVWYGSQGHQNQWSLKNAQGQTVASGGSGPSQHMAFQQSMPLSPGPYLLEAWDLGGDGWQTGYVQLLFSGYSFGPVQPQGAYQSWLVQVPATQVAVPVQNQMVAERLIRGHVGGDGMPLKGGGFEVQKTGVGVYIIRFSQAFADVPVALVSQAFESSGAMNYATSPVQLAAADAYQLRIETYDESGLPEDRAFSFMAIGAP